MAWRLTRAAEDDIVSIAETSIRLFGEQQARRYHDGLFELFDLISLNPRMARERTEIEPPVRVQPYKSHLVLYTVDEHGNVLVIRVRHGHEDWTAGA